MKELIEWLARSLVDHPERVNVNERITERAVVYELSVASEDVGQVIGKHGRTVKAIRNVVHAAAIREKKRVYLEIK